MCMLAAQASIGKRHELPHYDLWDNYFPFGEPETTLYLNAEDEPDEETVKRLKVCGADLSKIAYVDAAEMGINFYSPNIEEWINEAKPTAIAFDPVQQFFSGVDPYGAQLDMNNSASVRPALTRLKMLARKYNTAVILICHPNKNSFQTALHSTMGSNDFTAAPRSALYIGRNPDDKEQRIIAITKANSVPDEHQKSLAYRIDFKRGGITFEGESDLQADDIKATKRTSKRNEGEGPKAPRREEAAQWLDDYIENKGGYAKFSDIEAASKTAGISMSAVHRAQSKAAYIKKTSKGNGRIVYWFFDGNEPPEQMTLKGI